MLYYNTYEVAAGEQVDIDIEIDTCHDIIPPCSYYLHLLDEGRNTIGEYPGHEYDLGKFVFTIPGEDTEELSGRCYYAICNGNKFLEPFEAIWFY